MRKMKADKGQDRPPDPVTPLDLSRIFDNYTLPPNQKPVPARRPHGIKALLCSLRAMLRRLRRWRHTRR